MITDLKFVKGQEGTKRAIEIAVLGGHSILLCGPTGSGKSTLAECALALADSGHRTWRRSRPHPFEPCVGWNINLCVHCHSSRSVLFMW
jgi:MoxR-like ATPase